MKKKYFTPTTEVNRMFAHEWRRAKAILKPHLDNTKKPKLYLATSLDSGAIGMHWGRKGLHSIRMTRTGRWIHNSNVIALKSSRDLEDMAKTTRHEICHVIEQNHGTRFKLLLKALESQRQKEKATSPEVA